MAIEKDVFFGDACVRMRASALIPRFYRASFDRDMIADMNKLRKSYEKAKDKDDDYQLDVLDLTIFENVAWVMARHADPEHVPNTPDEWLDSIDGVFSFYQVLPQILELWGVSNKTTSVPIKK